MSEQRGEIEKDYEKLRAINWKKVVDDNIIGISIIKDDRFIYVNKIVEVFSGYSRDELYQMDSYKNLVYHEDIEKLENAIREVKKGKQTFYEIRYTTKDGKVRWLWGFMRPLKINGDTYILGNWVDVTKEKGLIQRLEESEKLYRIIFNNTGTGTIIIDEGAKILFANREAEKLLGLDTKDLIGKSAIEFVAEDDSEKVLRYHKLRRIHPSLAPRSYEVKLVDSGGKPRHVILTVSMIPGSKNSIVSFVDITKVREAEKKAKESEELYQTLFETSIDAIIAVSADMKIIDCNEAALNLFGMHKENIIGRSFTELGIVDEEYIPKLVKLFRQGIRKDIGYIELKIKRGKEVRWLEGSSALLRRDGKPFIFLNILRDITEKKRRQEELEMMVKKLELLHEIDIAILSGKTVEEIGITALKGLKDLINADIAFLSVFVEGGKKIITPDEIPEVEIESKNLLKVNDILQKNKFNSIEKILLGKGMRSYILTPLKARDEILGHLCLASKKVTAFETQERFIREVLTQLAITLHAAILQHSKDRALKQIKDNILSFAILADQIRNPLAVILGYAEIHDSKVKEEISRQVRKVEKVIEELVEKGWLESEVIKEFLEKK